MNKAVFEESLYPPYVYASMAIALMSLVHSDRRSRGKEQEGYR